MLYGHYSLYPEMDVAHSTQVRESVIEDLNITTIKLMEENISQQTKQKNEKYL